jgi:hypothetical protein
MHVRIYTPAEDMLAGRVVEAVRSTLPAATVTITTDLVEYTAIECEESERASVVLATGQLPADAFGGTGPTLALARRDATLPDEVPRVIVDPSAPDPALAALRSWLQAVAEGQTGTGVAGVSLGSVAGATAVGGLAGFLLGTLLGEDGDPPFGGELI